MQDEDGFCGPLEQAVIDSAAESGVSNDASFNAVVLLARSYAAQIDMVPADGGVERTKALYLGSNLLKALNEAGLTPAGRLAMLPHEAAASNERDRAAKVVSLSRSKYRAGA